jgi:hypothetical protein
MIALYGNNAAIKINCTAAGDIDYYVSGYEVMLKSEQYPFFSNGNATASGDTTICSDAYGTDGATRKDINFISIKNVHATDPNTITLTFVPATGATSDLYSATLLAGERFEYSV